MALEFKLDDIKKMPPKQKAMAVGVLYLILAVAYYFLFMQSTFETKSSLQTKLTELQEQVTEKERLAAMKNKYIRELKERKESLRMALTKLPSERKIPDLLYDFAQAGKESGMTSILFEPVQVEKKPPEKDKKPAEKKPADAKPGDKKAADAKDKVVEEKFYEEIPIKVAIAGGFHSTALFFEKIARLPRIVNIEDIVMTESKDPKTAGAHYINTTCVMKTYMFLEQMGEKKADEKK